MYISDIDQKIIMRKSNKILSITSFHMRSLVVCLNLNGWCKMSSYIINHKLRKFIFFLIVFMMYLVLLFFCKLYFFNESRSTNVYEESAGKSHARRDIRCIMLTMSKNATPFMLTEFIKCEPFVGTYFNSNQFDLLDIQTQNSLIDMSLQNHSGQFTNNISVNIFYNHAQIWKFIENQNSSIPYIVIEDDIALTSVDIDSDINSIISQFELEQRGNYIVKIFNQDFYHSYWNFIGFRHGDWITSYITPNAKVQTCQCSPPYETIGTTAYLVDHEGVKTLLKMQFPMKQHVDIFIHDVGCTLLKINLYIFAPSLVRLSGRSSTHVSALTYDNMKKNNLQWKTFLHRWRMSNCRKNGGFYGWNMVATWNPLRGIFF